MHPGKNFYTEIPGSGEIGSGHRADLTIFLASKRTLCLLNRFPNFLGWLAQLVEQETFNLLVQGSSP